MTSVLSLEPTRSNQPQAHSFRKSMLPPIPSTLLPGPIRRIHSNRGWPLKQILFACLVNVLMQNYFFRAVSNHDAGNSGTLLSISSGEGENATRRTSFISVEEEGEEAYGNIFEDEEEEDDDEPISYIEAFEQLLPNITWPLNGSYRQISASFGPVYPYRFHYGIDIRSNESDPVFAAYDGVVTRIETYKYSGLTIVICHRFDRPVKLHPDKNSTNRWFTYYSKLGETIEGLAKGDIITGGMKIATLGAAVRKRPELHFGLSIGTSCSLAYAQLNPTSTCNVFEYDPHIHPMLLQPAYPMEKIINTSELMRDPHISLQHTQHATPNTPAVYTITTPSEAPSINFYNVQYVSGSDSNVIKTHTFDLNLRIGFDPRTKDALSWQDTKHPHLSPHPFYGNNAVWQMDFVIPWSWLDPPPKDGDVFFITIGDIWNRTVSLGSTIGLLDNGIESEPPDIPSKPIETRPPRLSSVQAIFHVPISFLKGVRDDYAVSAAKKAAKFVLIPGVLNLSNEAWLDDVTCAISNESSCEPCHANDKCIIVDVTTTITYGKSPSNLVDTASLIADLHSKYEQQLYEEVQISSALATNCYAAKKRPASTMISLKLTFKSDSPEEEDEIDDDVKTHLEQSMTSFFNEQLKNGPGPHLMTVKNVTLVGEGADDSQRRRVSVIDTVDLSDTKNAIIDNDNNAHVKVYIGRRKRTLAGSSELDLRMLVKGDYVGPRPDFSGAIRSSVDSAEDELLNELKCSNNQNPAVCDYFSGLEGVKDTTPPPTNDNNVAAETPEEVSEQKVNHHTGIIAVVGVTVLLVGFLCLAVAGLIHLKRRKEAKREFNDAQSYPSYGIEEHEEVGGLNVASRAGGKKRSPASGAPETQRIPRGFCLGTQGGGRAIKPMGVPKLIFSRKKKESTSSKSDEAASHDESSISPLDTFSHGSEGRLKEHSTVGSRGEMSNALKTLPDGEFVQLGPDGTINRRSSDNGWMDLEKIN